MKTIGKITTFVVMVALIACAAINTAIHIKSGEVKELFVKEQIEQEVPGGEEPGTETPADEEINVNEEV